MKTDHELDVWIHNRVYELVESSPPTPTFPSAQPAVRAVLRRGVTMGAAVAIAGASFAVASLVSGAGPGPAGATTIVEFKAPSAGVVAGRIPSNAIVDGRINWSMVPDWVAVPGPNGSTIGYVRKADLNPSGPIIGPLNGGTYYPVCGTNGIDVYDSTLKNVIGAMYPNAGYVPNGTQPHCYGIPPTNSDRSPRKSGRG
jgi:hypothetical protein